MRSIVWRTIEPRHQQRTERRGLDAKDAVLHRIGAQFGVRRPENPDTARIKRPGEHRGQDEQFVEAGLAVVDGLESLGRVAVAAVYETERREWRRQR